MYGLNDWKLKTARPLQRRCVWYSQDLMTSLLSADGILLNGAHFACEQKWAVIHFVRKWHCHKNQFSIQEIRILFLAPIGILQNELLKHFRQFSNGSLLLSKARHRFFRYTIFGKYRSNNSKCFWKFCKRLACLAPPLCHP